MCTVRQLQQFNSFRASLIQYVYTPESSSDKDIQVKAFKSIVQSSIRFPLKVPYAFEASANTSPWRCTGVEYNLAWLYWYKLASRCLSAYSSPTIGAAAQFDNIDPESLDFSALEEVLAGCRYARFSHPLILLFFDASIATLPNRYSHCDLLAIIGMETV